MEVQAAPTVAVGATWSPLAGRWLHCSCAFLMRMLTLAEAEGLRQLGRLHVAAALPVLFAAPLLLHQQQWRINVLRNIQVFIVLNVPVELAQRPVDERLILIEYFEIGQLEIFPVIIEMAGGPN